MEDKHFIWAVVLIVLAGISALMFGDYRGQLESQQHQEEHDKEDLTRLFYILRAAEQRHAGYLAYDVPQADPFSRAQRVEYFNACGYEVVAEGREGHFIVKRVSLPEGE